MVLLKLVFLHFQNLKQKIQMRKALLLLVAFSSIGFAQETSNDTVKHWTRKGVFTLLANQSSFSNWQAGG